MSAGVLLTSAGGSALEADLVAEAADSLSLRLAMPEQVSAGDEVPVVLQLRNVGPRPLDLYLRGREIAFDIVVTREEGGVVWRRLQDEMIPAIIQMRRLEPGDVLELRDRWGQRTSAGDPVEPGSYLVSGVILTDGQPLRSAAAPLRIRPR